MWLPQSPHPVTSFPFVFPWGEALFKMETEHEGVLSNSLPDFTE